MTQAGSGLRAVVTGAASGLGRAVALRLARDGARVALADINEAGLAETAEAVTAAGGEPLVQALDVRDDAAWAALADAVRARWGGVDLLVNNAGVADLGRVTDAPDAAWQRQFDINLMGVIRGCRAFVPMMTEAGGGHVANVASAAGFSQAPGMAPYNVAKAGVIAVSETLRAEVAPDGITVSVICPAFFRTNLVENSGAGSEGQRKAVQGLMDASTVTAEDVADDIVRAARSGRFMVISHRKFRWFWLLKRLLPERWFAQMRAVEQRRRGKR
ncbi:MAG: SDR family oxidoreductase [Alphaproteobacteria bacterium]|nr:SDR family oxidoreductase [Alphaproteobacteria bacterium]